MPFNVKGCSKCATQFKLRVGVGVDVAGGVVVSRTKSSLTGRGLALLLAVLSGLASGTAAMAQDASCMARCQAQESQCLQETKGDRAKCNAVATQCFQGCRKPR